MAQSYVPPIVTSATTTLYSSGSTAINPGQVAADKAGNVYYINHAMPYSVYEIPVSSPAATTTAPVALITGIGQYNADGLFVDPKGNLWVTNGNSGGLLELPAGSNGIPNTASVPAAGYPAATAFTTQCTATSTTPCSWSSSSFATNLTGSYIQPSAIFVDASSNVYLVDYYDGTSSGKYNRVIKFNAASNPTTGTLLADNLTTNNQASVAADGAGNAYYCENASGAYNTSGASGKVSLVSGGTATTVGTTAKLTTALITSCTGVSADQFGNLFISGTNNSTQQISEVPFEGTALNFADEFGIISGLTDALTFAGNLDTNGNFYYASTTNIDQVQINDYNFGNVALGNIGSKSLSVYFNAAQTATNSYFPTGSPTTNTSIPYLQSFPYSGTKTFGGGVAQAVGSVGTVTMNFQPLRAGLAKGSFTPRTNGNDYGIVNLQGNGIAPEALFFPGTASLLFTSTTTTTKTTLNAPQGLAVDTFGDIFVADTANGKVDADCLATTTQNEDGTGGNTSNSFCSLATYTGLITQLGTTFTSPVAVAVDGAEGIYVLDSATTAAPLTFINGQSVASTALIAAGTKIGGTALSGPMGMAIDGYTNLYIADTGNNRIVEAHQYGATQTGNIVLVPSTKTFGGTALSGPSGIAVDAAQNLYIADTGNNRIVEYSATGVASVMTTTGVTLSSPYAVAVYPSGALVVSDRGNGVVLITGTTAQVLSFTTAYSTTGAKGIALDPFGNILVSNTNANQILQLNVASPTVTFPNTNDGSISSPIGEVVGNVGNASLAISGVAVSNTNYQLDSSNTCTSTTTVAVGASCMLVTKFSPQSVGSNLTASVTLTDNELSYTLNNASTNGVGGNNQDAAFATSGTQSLNLTGNGTSAGAPQTITFPPFNPSTVQYNTTPIPLMATASSGLPVTFSVLSGPGQITGTAANPTLTITGVGSIVVAADQNGSTSYQAAPEQTQTLMVTQASQTISFPASTPTSVSYSTNGMPTTVTLAAASTSGLPVTYTVTGPATLNGSTLTVTGLGTFTVTANQAGNADYTAAPQVQTNIVVTPLGTVATPTFSVVGGTYNALDVQPLTITDATSGAAIYFSTDGSTPSNTSTTSKLYVPNGQNQTPINLAGNETVKAIAYLAGYTPSAVASESFVIDTAAEILTTSLSASSLSLSPGQSGTLTITVTPQNGIVTPVTFSCSGLPVGATCVFNPNPVQSTAAQIPFTTVLTVTAPTTISAVQHRSNPLLPETTLALIVCLFGWRKRRSLRVGLLVAVAVISIGWISGCGSSSPTQTSTITVAAAGAGVRSVVTFTLNVH